MRSFRVLILPLILALATLVGSGAYAQPAHEECDCCTEMQQMVCDACKTCVSHGLVASAPLHAEFAPAKALALTSRLNPSGHTEDIWHPPKPLS